MGCDAAQWKGRSHGILRLLCGESLQFAMLDMSMCVVRVPGEEAIPRDSAPRLLVHARGAPVGLAVGMSTVWQSLS